MHLTIWFINSVFENACSTAIIGLLYGPVYPTILSLAVDLLPSEAHMITMAIMWVPHIRSRLSHNTDGSSSSGFANLGSCEFLFLIHSTHLSFVRIAIFPFLAGAMSNVRGPKILVYMTVAQTVTLIALWILFPTKARS